MNERRRPNGTFTHEIVAPVRDRLYARGVRTESGCLEWTGYRNPQGYGNIMIPGPPKKRSRLVHRVAYELEFGPIPEGMSLLHSCDNPPCFEVKHLHPGTLADNNREMAERGRAARGEAHHWAVITEDCAREIKRRIKSGQSLASIGREVGVPYHTVLNIKHGGAWRWVECD